MTDPIVGNVSLYQDVQSIEQIKNNPDQQTALGKAADQFEVKFLQMVLKDMSEATNSLSEGDSLFNSNEQQFYQEMYVDQLAATMVKDKGIGLSDSIVNQLSHELKSKS